MMKSQRKVLKLIVDTSVPARRQLTPAEADERKVRNLTTLKAKKIHLEGLDELVLQCGKASVTLQRDGKVVIRGTYVETRSAGTNRIKGATVKVN